VKAVPGTLQDVGAPFVTTHWSVIAACSDLSSAAAHARLAQLCRDYWPPLYSFVRRPGFDRADAQDLVQDFFAFLLQSKAYAQTDRTKGKFRSFLLASLKHYLADLWDREHALKRGGQHEFVILEEEMEVAETLYGNDSVAASLDEEQDYERRWAATVMTQALERLSSEFVNGPKTQLFNGLRPFLTGGIGLPSQEETAARLEMPVETLRSQLSRLRVRCREVWREEVAR
jgi:RNA polymerase sigma factor (sigma-70 family)